MSKLKKGAKKAYNSVSNALSKLKLHDVMQNIVPHDVVQKLTPKDLLGGDSKAPTVASGGDYSNPVKKRRRASVRTGASDTILSSRTQP